MNIIKLLIVRQQPQRWITLDDFAAEGKQYALRAIEVGADDAYTLSRASLFFAYQFDVRAADVIIDQAIAVNPNSPDAWRMRGLTSVFLGRHELAIEQYHHAMRLNPLDPQIYLAELGLANANFFLRRFEAALSWATKALARQNNFAPAMMLAMISHAMLGHIADAQKMLARRIEAGFIETISQARKRNAYFQQEDAELWVEACRIAGVPE